jgi:hypothetical protein
LSKNCPAALNQHRRARIGQLAFCSRLANLRHCSHHQQGTGKEDPDTGKISNSIENQNEDGLLLLKHFVQSLEKRFEGMSIEGVEQGFHFRIFVVSSRILDDVSLEGQVKHHF